jgi:hypothetical protein
MVPRVVLASARRQRKALTSDMRAPIRQILLPQIYADYENYGQHREPAVIPDILSFNFGRDEGVNPWAEQSVQQL